MWIRAVWHGKCNPVRVIRTPMKKTILFTLAIILLYYFLLAVLLPY
jgi:hypothetical protein